MRVAAAAAVAMLALAAAGGCGRNSPTEPAGSFAISGHVRLTGFLVDDAGQFAGTRNVDDADSVLVELRFGHAVVGRTLTTDGTYRFGGLGRGAYQTLASVFGDVADATQELTIVDHDLVAGHTLVLASVGDLYPIPNPASGLVRVLFDVPDSTDVQIRVQDLQGRIVQHVLTKSLGRGLHEVQWNGRDDAGHLAQGPLYWITYAAGRDQRAQLLFR